MDPNSKFSGLRTVVYHVADVESAKLWYAKVLQVAPYCDEPYYVGFNVGGFELGLHPIESGDPHEGIGNSVAYWGVANATAELQRLIELGATPHGEIQEVGSGIKVADVLDPFGNVLGIIENPHFPNEAEPNTASQ